jgi:hypothetical protein
VFENFAFWGVCNWGGVVDAFHWWGTLLHVFVILHASKNSFALIEISMVSVSVIICRRIQITGIKEGVVCALVQNGLYRIF